MGLFDWFKREKEEQYVIESTTIPLTTLVRWYLYDMQIEDPESIAAELGINSISEEGAEKERQDSDERMLPISMFTDYAAMVADINAQASAVIKERGLKDALKEDLVELDEEEIQIIEEYAEASYEVFQQIGFTAIMSALSIAFSTGLLLPGAAWAGEVTTDEQ